MFVDVLSTFADLNIWSDYQIDLFGSGLSVSLLQVLSLVLFLLIGYSFYRVIRAFAKGF